MSARSRHDLSRPSTRACRIRDNAEQGRFDIGCVNGVTFRKKVNDVQVQDGKDQVLVERLFAGKVLVDGLFAGKVLSAEKVTWHLASSYEGSLEKPS